MISTQDNLKNKIMELKNYINDLNNIIDTTDNQILINDELINNLQNKNIKLQGQNNKNKMLKKNLDYKLINYKELAKLNKSRIIIQKRKTVKTLINRFENIIV